MNGADAVAKSLELQGVTTVYGYPGVAICPVYDSLINTNIHAVLVRSEANAAHAASGEARISGKPGVCICTSGPGATNLITGIAGDLNYTTSEIHSVDVKILRSDAFGAVRVILKFKSQVHSMSNHRIFVR